jgi:hypothetical protein
MAVHSLLPDGKVRCDEGDVPHATTIDRCVTCRRCLHMIETAKRAAKMQTIPPERWP